MWAEQQDGADDDHVTCPRPMSDLSMADLLKSSRDDKRCVLNTTRESATTEGTVGEILGLHPVLLVEDVGLAPTLS